MDEGGLTVVLHVLLVHLEGTWVEAFMVLVRDQAREKADRLLICQAKAAIMIKLYFLMVL